MVRCITSIRGCDGRKDFECTLDKSVEDGNTTRTISQSKSYLWENVAYAHSSASFQTSSIFCGCTQWLDSVTSIPKLLRSFIKKHCHYFILLPASTLNGYHSCKTLTDEHRPEILTTSASPPRVRQTEHVPPFPSNTLSSTPSPDRTVIDRHPTSDTASIPATCVSILYPTLRIIWVNLPQLDLCQDHACQSIEQFVHAFARECGYFDGDRNAGC